MKLIRYALYGLGGLLLLVGAALVYVLVFFDPNAHKPELVRLVREQTGRELSVPGALKLSVYPWVAIDVGRASLGNAPGFGAAPMVEFERARLGVRLLPLLRGRIEIGAVTLDAPTIRLAVDASGRDNWSDLLHQQPGAASGAGGAMPGASVASVRIVDGRLDYDDRKGGSTIALRELNIETGALAPGQPFDLQLAGALQQRGKPALSFKFSGRSTLDPGASRYRVESPALGLVLHGADFPSGALAVDLRFASADADLQAQTLKLPGMELRVAGARLSGDLKATKLLDAPSLGGNVQLAETPLRPLLEALGVRLPATRDAAAFKALAFSGTLSASSRALMISGLKLRLDDSTATGRAGIGNLDTMALAFDLKLDRINIDRYLAPQPPAAAAAAAPQAAAPPTPIPVELIRGLGLRGSLAVGEAVFAGIQYQNLRVGLNAGGGRLRVYPSEAQMYGGQYHGDITLDVSGRVPRASFDEHVDGVDFAPLFRDMFDTRRVSGRGSGAIRAVATGADSAALLRTLTGSVDFRVDNGAFDGVDLWYEIRRAQALLKQQPLPARSGPERTPFSAVSASGRISNGVLASDDLLAATQFLQVKGRGSADIASGALDFRLDVAVMKLPDAAGEAAGAAGMVGFTVPVQVSGSFSAPKLRPDVGALVKARVQQEVDKRKEELKQKLQEKLQDKLKGLFGN